MYKWTDNYQKKTKSSLFIKKKYQNSKKKYPIYRKKKSLAEFNTQPLHLPCINKKSEETKQLISERQVSMKGLRG